MSNRRRLKQPQHPTSSSSSASPSATNGTPGGSASNSGAARGSPGTPHTSSKHRSSSDKKTGGSAGAASKGSKGMKRGTGGRIGTGAIIKWVSLGLILLSLGFYAFRAFQQMSFRNRAVTPFPEQILDKHSSMPYADAALFWGSYRPGVYFGMKARSAQSPVFGLMWLVQFDRQRPDFRHNCDQQHKLPRYGWVVHDGVNFGVQEIVEKDFTVRVSFVKLSQVGSHGGDWTAKIEVSSTAINNNTDTTRHSPSHLYVSLFFYVALDGQGELESIVEEREEEGNSFLSKVRGYSNELGYFDVVFDKQPNVKYNYLEAHTPSLHLIREAVQHYAESISMKSPAA